MLATIGVSSIEELFADIPESLRLARELALDPGLSEQEVFEELSALAARNVSTEDELSFLGAGMYDHYIPSLVDSIILRSEFLTPYTPYQPEISQGGLQAMFEYQTAISRADRAADLQRLRVRGPERRRRGRIRRQARRAGAAGSWSRAASIRIRAQTLRTMAHGWGMEVVEAPLHAGRHRAARAERRRQRRDRPAAELPRRGRGPRADRRGRPTRPVRWRSAPVTRCRSRCSRRRANAASTSRSARGRRSATGSTSAARRSASSPPPRS